MATVVSPRRTFPDEIVSALRERILRGEFLPGDCLPPERELAVTLGTNRNTLREALRSLEAQGLVRARQGDGVRVLDFRRTGDMSLLGHYLRFASPAEQPVIINDLLRLRSIVAVEIVRRAALAAEPADVAVLRQRLVDLEAALDSREPLAVVGPELEMYRAVIAAGKSLASLWFFNSFERVIDALCEAYPGVWLTAPSFLTEWRCIVNGIAAHDVTTAEAAIRRLHKENDDLVSAFLSLLQQHAPQPQSQPQAQPQPQPQPDKPQPDKPQAQPDKPQEASGATGQMRAPGSKAASDK